MSRVILFFHQNVPFILNFCLERVAVVRVFDQNGIAGAARRLGGRFEIQNGAADFYLDCYCVAAFDIMCHGQH